MVRLDSGVLEFWGASKVPLARHTHTMASTMQFYVESQDRHACPLGPGA